AEFCLFLSSRRRHTRSDRDWSSDVCSSDLPDVRQPGPGSCPKCGMALEPEAATLGHEDNPELKDMTRRLRVALALTVPVFLLAMADMLPGGPFHSRVLALFQPWVELLLATPVVLWAGWPFFQRMWASFVNASP